MNWVYSSFFASASMQHSHNNLRSWGLQQDGYFYKLMGAAAPSISHNVCIWQICHFLESHESGTGLLHLFAAWLFSSDSASLLCLDACSHHSELGDNSESRKKKKKNSCSQKNWPCEILKSNRQLHLPGTPAAQRRKRESLKGFPLEVFLKKKNKTK